MNSVTKFVTILALTLGLPAAIVYGFKLESDCTKDGFFRSPDDCAQFYRCVDISIDGRGYFKKYTLSCPDGLVFDEPASTCNYPWASPPCDTSEEEEDIEETTTVQAETEPDPEQGDQVEVEEEALEEVTTVQTEVEAEPEQGEHAEEEQEESQAEIEAEPEQVDHADEEEESQAEVEPDQDIENEGDIEETTTEIETEPEAENEEDLVEEETTTAQAEVEPEQVGDQECTTDGYFKNPDDCKGFYRCVYFQKFDFTCPDGTVFDETITACNYPSEAPPCDTTEEEDIMEETATAQAEMEAEPEQA